MIVPAPTDEQILAAVRRWGNRAMTYVVRNTLSMEGFHVETPWVLRQLKRLEEAGAVERVSSSYAVQLCWSATLTHSSPPR
jgi:Fe2+ or Zn2+ uptake regulation protein